MNRVRCRRKTNWSKSRFFTVGDKLENPQWSSFCGICTTCHRWVSRCFTDLKFVMVSMTLLAVGKRKIDSVMETFSVRWFVFWDVPGFLAVTWRKSWFCHKHLWFCWSSPYKIISENLRNKNVFKTRVTKHFDTIFFPVIKNKHIVSEWSVVSRRSLSPLPNKPIFNQFIWKHIAIIHDGNFETSTYRFAEQRWLSFYF